MKSVVHIMLLYMLFTEALVFCMKENHLNSASVSAVMRSCAVFKKISGVHDHQLM